MVQIGGFHGDYCDHIRTTTDADPGRGGTRRNGGARGIAGHDGGPVADVDQLIAGGGDCLNFLVDELVW